MGDLSGIVPVTIEERIPLILSIHTMENCTFTSLVRLCLNISVDVLSVYTVLCFVAQLILSAIRFL